jgi:hypothetical protein
MRRPAAWPAWWIALDQARSAYHDGKDFVLSLPHPAAALMVQQR